MALASSRRVIPCWFDPPSQQQPPAKPKEHLRMADKSSEENKVNEGLGKKSGKPRVTRKGSKTAAAKKRAKQHISSDDLPKKTLEDALKVSTAIKENYGKQATWEDIA